jgi:hypothetical protein
MMNLPRVDESIDKPISPTQHWNPKPSVSSKERSPFRFLCTLLLAGMAIAGLLFGTTCPALAANPDQLTQFLETHECPGCDLQGADLRGMNLRASNLEGANLENAYLMATNLRQANLRNTNLEGARLYSAILTDADLTGASVQTALIEGAVVCHTRIPSGKIANRDCGQYAG